MLNSSERFPNNPIIEPHNIRPSIEGCEVECVLNPGAFRFQNKTWLILRVAEKFKTSEEDKNFYAIVYNPTTKGGVEILGVAPNSPDFEYIDKRGFKYQGIIYPTTTSHLRLAYSEDNYHFHISERPVLLGIDPLEEFGMEDCRVAKIDQTYYLTYTSVSRHNFGVSMVSTDDWQTFRHYGMILAPSNKDCAIFPQRIGEFYYAMHRPTLTNNPKDPWSGRHVWLQKSTNLRYWGDHTPLFSARPGMWDSKRIGAGDSPHLLPEGWLEIYHGVNDEDHYCLGAILFDRDDPSKVLKRSHYPIMKPTEPYEQKGFYGKVVFTNGTLLEGDSILVYYGAADKVVCGARISLEEIFKSFKPIKE